jgi:hypothetical protein
MIEKQVVEAWVKTLPGGNAEMMVGRNIEPIFDDEYSQSSGNFTFCADEPRVVFMGLCEQTIPMDFGIDSGD